MAYKSIRDCVKDLEKNSHLIRIKQEVDPDLEMAEIHRRVFAAGGPAILFERVRGSDFPAVSNLFGTMDRARFIFRKTIRRVQSLIGLKADPTSAFKNPMNLYYAMRAGFNALPRRVPGGAVRYRRTTIDRLPFIKSWPDDGGPFITLPQVYTEDAFKPGVMKSNLGMYRVQMAGNQYRTNEQIGLHYQIHRGIGVHHSRAIEKGRPFPVSIFVGGPPAHTFSAVMPLPEGLPEVAFAGALAGRAFRYSVDRHRDKDSESRVRSVVSADADFCITGIVDPQLLPEGPFGDHLGYYSLTHDFPALRITSVYHRKNAIWPFTVVGRPPQEDTIFGSMIHELTGPMVPVSIPGLRSMHAVDQAGVHPLMIAIGEERYTPYESERRPAEILTVANAILGFGQASLAKYLWIAAYQDNPDLDTHHMEDFFCHMLSRVDWSRDLHFQTSTTMDTLDYSGVGINQGSRVVIAAAGEVKRKLGSDVPEIQLPETMSDPRVIFPGVLSFKGPAFRSEADRIHIDDLCNRLSGQKEKLQSFPMIVVSDDSEFTARNLDNFLWVTFTRSNPSHDIYGVDSFVEFKHWGCHGPLIIDARIKPHHAPPLESDPKVVQRVDELAAPGGPLHGIF
ncbi:MAG: UbiD family decarboxylase [Leptospiraceae bacterium]